MRQCGVQIVSYIPQNAYLVYGDAGAVARMQSWALGTNCVQWEGDYIGDYKLHPAARLTDRKGRMRRPMTDRFTVQLLEDTNANPATLALIDRWKLAAPGAAGVDAKQVLAYVAAEQAAKLRAPAAGSAVPAADGLRPGDMAALAPIAAPQNQTMVIGTPAGYVSRPPRRAWPFVVVAGVLLGLGGGVTADVMFGPPRGVVASRMAMVPGTTVD